jgi:hypothetical protein
VAVLCTLGNIDLCLLWYHLLYAQSAAKRGMKSKLTGIWILVAHGLSGFVVPVFAIRVFMQFLMLGAKTCVRSKRLLVAVASQASCLSRW